jgi:preprotein translocase subunit SecE
MAKESKKDNKNKRHFFKDFKAELKKVIWPTPKQLVKSTMAVVFIVIVTAVIVFVLDVVFETINSKGINALKSSIKNSVVVNEVIEDSNKIVESNEAITNTEINETVAE